MNLLKILTKQASPGMKVAEDVYTFNNQLIIPKGTILTDKAITRIKFYSIKNIMISVPDKAMAPVLTDSYTEHMHSERVKNTTAFKDFNNSLLNSTALLKNELNDIANGKKEIHTPDLYKQICTLAEKARNGIHLFDMLHCLRDLEDETFVHSINVALISNTMAKWLNFGKKDIETATLCGLLHDIGKLTIPKEVMFKTEKLTEEEFEIVRSHTTKGYNILQSSDINIHIKMTAIMHHERCDGSGYPMSMKGDQIDRFAKIVMIADVYDAMTSARVYRGALCPFEVLSMFNTEGFKKFEPKYLMTFVEHVYQTYLNNTVRLNNQAIGKIVMMNQFSSARPVIAFPDNTYVDLTKETDLYIEAIL